MIICDTPNTHFPGIPGDLPTVAICLCCYTAVQHHDNTPREHHIRALRKLMGWQR